MQISPRRRQRALKVHELRQQGRSLRNIGKQLDISHATVLADLKLIETRWSEITQQSADDFQLEQFSLIQERLRTLLRRNLLKEFGGFSPTDFVRIYEAQNRELAILLREARRLAAQLHQRADLREIEPGQLPQELDFPLDELTAAPKPTKPAQSTKSAQPAQPQEPANTRRDLPKPSKPNHPNHPIPRKTPQIPPPAAPRKNSGQPPAELTPDQLKREAETFLRNYSRQDLPAAAG